MVINPLKAFLFLAGGSAAAAGTAYMSGALDPYISAQPVQIAALPKAQPDPAAGKGERLPAAEAPVAEPAKPAAEAAAPSPAVPAVPAPGVPAFDVVRVEPDGSVVIAGQAPPQALVELLAGAAVIGGAKADAIGDFAIVLDKPLAPGDYQLTLRASASGGGGGAVASAETAVISIPKTPTGEVLAMVEEPGKPAELITTPQPAPTKAPEVAAKPAETAPAASAGAMPEPQPGSVAAPAEAAKAEVKPVDPAAPAASSVAVQAVEIEGKKVFVAGVSDPGRIVRAYANEILLGQAKSAPNGRFLVEAERDLPIGNYIIRADVLGADGVQVVARAAVPFEREPGEAIAAVAPTADTAAKPAPAQPAASPVAAVDPASPADPAKPAVPADAASSAAAAEPAQPGQAGEKAAEIAAPGTAEPAKVDAALAANPPEITAPKLEAVASAVIIRRGDSLWRISRRVYGRGIRYSTIYLANQDQIADPDRIWPGQVFSVPDKTKEGEAADMNAMGEQMTSKAKVEAASE